MRNFWSNWGKKRYNFGRADSKKYNLDNFDLFYKLMQVSNMLLLTISHLLASSTAMRFNYSYSKNNQNLSYSSSRKSKQGRRRCFLCFQLSACCRRWSWWMEQSRNRPLTLFKIFMLSVLTQIKQCSSLLQWRYLPLHPPPWRTNHQISTEKPSPWIINNERSDNRRKYS